MYFHEKPTIVAINWEGIEAHAEGMLYSANPYAADPFKRALWSKGWSDGQHKRAKPETAFDAYWIVDDVLDGQTKEGFQLFYGCPFRAVGTRQGEFLQLCLALAAVSDGEPVYRVKLARRHGVHSVKLIREAEKGDTKNSRFKPLIVRDPAKAFDQAKTVWEELVITALEEQGELDRSDAQSVLEVKSVLADTLYEGRTDPANAAAQILRRAVRQPA